tara:strand:+ start:132 stop:350 length:219 start_codon:yes stop_codon:yes gene_type:complete
MRKIPLLLILSFISFWSYPQCSMCRAVAESSQKHGGSIADSLNSGILYLMAFPYLLLLSALIYLYFQQQQTN